MASVDSTWVLNVSGLFSSLGSSPVRAAVLAGSLTALVAVQRWRAAGYVLFVVTVVHLLNRVTKALVGRQRLPDPERAYALAGSVRLLIVMAVLAGAGWVIGRRRTKAAFLLAPIYLGVVLLQHAVTAVPVMIGADSFPSGHASNTMALLAALTVVRPTGRRWSVLALLGLGFVVLVGVSRVTLGFHYPIDVLAGWFLAISVTLLARPLFRPHAQPDPR